MSGGLSQSIFNGWTSIACSLMGLVSPVAALNYARSRQVLLSYRTDYKASSRRGPNAKWNPSRDSADAMIRRDRDLAVARSRELVRDSEHVSGALRRICNNVVFKGIWPQISASKALDIKLCRKLEKVFKKWAMVVDYDGIQRLILRHLWQDGEILVHYFPDPTFIKKGVVPLGIELIETDQLDRMIDGELGGGNYARHGIEYDSYGHKTAYHILPVYPGDGCIYRGDSRRIPAEQIEHIFERERASQSRGMPWLTTIVMTMHDFEDYQNSERIAARLMASFAYFVYNTTPGMSGKGFPGAENGSGLPKYLTGPGQILDVPAGKQVEAQQYNRPGDSYESFSKNTLKGASAGVGASYESFSNDYSDASYSSARSATLEERRGYEVLQWLLNKKINNPTFTRFWSFLFLSGAYADLPAEPEVSWLNPGWSWVDPTKDANAAKTELLDLKTVSRREICARQGRDLDDVVNDLAHENEMLKEKGLLGEHYADEAQEE